MVTLLIALVLLEVFGIFNEFHPLFMVGVFVICLGIMGVMYLASGGAGLTSGFYFLMSFVCILALYLFFRILF